MWRRVFGTEIRQDWPNTLRHILRRIFWYFRKIQGYLFYWFQNQRIKIQENLKEGRRIKGTQEKGVLWLWKIERVELLLFFLHWRGHQLMVNMSQRSIQLFQFTLSDQSFKLTRQDRMVVWVEVEGCCTCRILMRCNVFEGFSFSFFLSLQHTWKNII